MHIAFLYNRADQDPALFAEDDDPERSPVVAALRRLGHDVTPIACTLDLASVRRQLELTDPEAAFNRVESLGGSDAMAVAIAMLLDAMHVPYTGCHTESLVATTNKTSTKKRLIQAGLPTPEWIAEDCGLRIADCGLSEAASRVVLDPDQHAIQFSLATTLPNPKSEIRNPQFILKSIYEHASFEMDDDSVIGPAAADVITQLVRKRTAMTGKPFFAERFIEGREFNLSLLGDAPEVLPPAEIDFSAFPAEKPRIVGFGAKWTNASFEFQNTPRRFNFPPTDAPLVRRLTDLAVECWRLFGLRGYARVDFRVDLAGQPWILEINTNPCIAPTSGFAAALEQAGLSYDDGIQRIIDAALPQSELDSPQRTQRARSREECKMKNVQCKMKNEKCEPPH